MGAYHATNVTVQRTHLRFAVLSSQPKVSIKISSVNFYHSDLASVSVIHSQTMVADAYATAMMAMGSQSATVLAKQRGLSVILILNNACLAR
jgi:hypothetical protein